MHLSRTTVAFIGRWNWDLNAYIGVSQMTSQKKPIINLDVSTGTRRVDLTAVPLVFNIHCVLTVSIVLKADITKTLPIQVNVLTLMTSLTPSSHQCFISTSGSFEGVNVCPYDDYH